MVGITTHEQWRYMKRKLLDGLDCVLCGKPATELHHPQKEYGSSYEYFNAENQIPLCKDCHYTKVHISKTYPATERMKSISPNIVSFRMCRGGGFD
jgi:hypothetical protein